MVNFIEDEIKANTKVVNTWLKTWLKRFNYLIRTYKYMDQSSFQGEFEVNENLTETHIFPVLIKFIEPYDFVFRDQYIVAYEILITEHKSSERFTNLLKKA